MATNRAGGTSYAVVLLCASWLMGCGPVDVGGTWTGSWITKIFSGELTWTLEQDADAVTGRSHISGSWCVADADLTALLDNHQLDGSFTNGIGRVELDARVSAGGDRIDGSFDVTAGACLGTDGSFVLRR